MVASLTPKIAHLAKNRHSWERWTQIKIKSAYISINQWPVLPDQNVQKSPICGLKIAKIATFGAQNRGNIASFLPFFLLVLPWVTLFIAFLCDKFFKTTNFF